jgi:BirA family biotin operon repressor/biotin-[acetyl-CoA-carboxylase] ligase
MKETLLTVLKNNRGSYVSGQELSRRLGVTRTTVWKHVRALRSEGYAVDSSPRRGYRLVGTPDLLLAAEIMEGLATVRLGRRVVHLNETASTNRVARELGAGGEPEGTLVLAEVQHGGKGRLGRAWSAPAGGIWLSLILRPDFPPNLLQLLTLTAAVAAAEASENVAGISPGIKWPNDLLWRGKKLAGILTEGSTEADRVDCLVLGVGINANLREEDFPLELRGLATSLLLAGGRPVDRAAWVRWFLWRLERYYLNTGEGTAQALSEWRRRSVTLGQQVVVSMGSGTVEGTAVDIDDRGALLVETEGGLETVLAGDVTLKSDTGEEK